MVRRHRPLPGQSEICRRDVLQQERRQSCVVDVRTRKERQIQPRTGGLFPAWAPDGKWIAFSGLNVNGTLDTIHLMHPDGTGIVDLGPMGECATWSPDSSRLMYCSLPGDGNWAFWVMNADGSERSQLTNGVIPMPPATQIWSLPPSR